MLMVHVTIKLNIDIAIWISDILFCFSCLLIKLSKIQNAAICSQKNVCCYLNLFIKDSSCRK